MNDDLPAPSAAAPPSPPATPATPAIEQTLEKLARELLQERRTDRRWRLGMRLAWFGLFCVLLWTLTAQRMHGTAPSGPHTALVELRGEIAADTEASAEQLISGLRQAFEDSGAQAVVIRINSPGGSPVQAGIVNDEIRRLKAKHQKKVYAVVEEMCASGAYYVAVAADEIFVDKASLVGSIGVLMDGFGFTGLMDKLGVERRLLTAGENKGMLDPFSPQNARQKAYAQAMIDQIHRQFIAVVRQGRGARLKESPDTFSGLFWNGEEAVKLGLADSFGNLDYVAREVVKAEEVIDYTPRENVAERLAKRFGAAIGEGAVRTLNTLARIH
ncbi:S49 family peptidase [Aquabacterium sp.]|uniref:S49 family peptidase n=1 Tax=Aquabacterium sp. TaxID=1872578 RepID=UPI0037832745